MLNKLKQISTKLVESNPYWDYRIDEYTMPNGKSANYYYVETPGSTFIIPVMEKGLFVMTRQYRYLNGRISIEFPGGGLKKGISPEDNAVNELVEEAGLIAGILKPIGSFNPYNGVTNEICRVFAAYNLTRVKPIPEESEEFEIITMSGEEIGHSIISGEIWDGMTLAAWAIYQHTFSFE